MPEEESTEPVEGGKESSESERLIQGQLGKTIDFDSSGYGSEEDEAWEALGLGLESLDAIREQQKQFAVSYLDDALQRYPILKPSAEHVRSLLDSKDDISLAIRPFSFLSQSENAGDTIYSRIRGFWGVGVYVDIGKQDWQDGQRIAKTFPKEIKEQIPEEIEKTEKLAGRVSEVIGQYENGQKPTPEDCQNGRSISEPILQMLIGGTPKEGLSWPVVYMTGTPYLLIGQHQVGDAEKVGVDLQVSLGDYELLRESSQVASDYIRFVSDIMTEQGWVLGETYKSEGKNRLEILQKYLDIEWERKDEALSIARRIKEVLDKKARFLQSLTGQETPSS